MMKRKMTALSLSLFLAAALFLPMAAHAEPIVPATPAAFDVPCKAAILIDEDSGTVLYEKNADEQRPIASITKVMTLLLAFRALEAGRIRLGDVVPVSEHAYGMGGSQIWLEPGEQLTLDEMLKAICICSANDAAVAVSEFVGGSEPVFVEEMNAMAKELGMENTHFCNACGLDEAGHVSTARDVALMSREMLLHHKEVEDYCTIWMDSLRGGETQLVNTNKLLKNYQGITGLKTGTTGGAGVCISASASRGGLDLIAVVLGAASSKERFTAATALLDYGFAAYKNEKIRLPDDAPQHLPVGHGVEETVTLEYAAPGSHLMPKESTAELTVHLELPETVQAPVGSGRQLGTVRVMQGDEEIAQYPVRAKAEVRELSFLYCFWRLADALLLCPAGFVQNE